jgi:hypothetical protein
MLNWGLDWIQTQRKTHMAVKGFLKTPDGPEFEIWATPCITQGEVVRDKVTVQIQHFKFIFNYAELLATKIPIQRGIIFITDTGKYELILDRQNTFEFDDELEKGIILSFAKDKSC